MNSWFPSGPRIGDGMTSKFIQCNSDCAKAKIFSTHCCRIFSSFTTPCLPMFPRSVSNCGLTSTAIQADGARSGWHGGRTFVSEMNDTSPTNMLIGSGISSVESCRAFVFWRLMTRGSATSLGWS